MAVTLILFADFLGYGGANARKNDKSDDYEDYTADDHQTSSSSKSKQGKLIDKESNHRNSLDFYFRDRARLSLILERTLREKYYLMSFKSKVVSRGS